MTILEYEVKFYQLAHHATIILLMVKEKVFRFLKGLIYPIRQLIFCIARDGTSLKSVVSTTKEVELMQREAFGDPKRVRTTRQSLGASLGARCMSRRGSSF